MKKMKNKGGIEKIKTRYGYMFLAPWIFGCAVFVLVPLITCLLYSFSDVTMRPEGLVNKFVGITYYKFLFIEDPYYIDQVIASLSSLFTSVPIIIVLSLIIALILNKKFKGRTLARAVFFLPVIIASGAVMQVLTNFNMQQDVATAIGGGASNATEYMQIIDFYNLLERLNLPPKINDLLSGYLNDTFNLIWSCGVQILLFVSGLQTIPSQLYEVGQVEGISRWEELWYITIPMMGRVFLLVGFYTMVETFITKGAVVQRAINTVVEQDYSKSSAMLWPYFIIVALIMGIVLSVYSKLCLKKWE